MKNLLLGFILGIVVSTIGFNGIISLADRGVEVTKTFVEDVADENAQSKQGKLPTKIDNHSM